MDVLWGAQMSTANITRRNRKDSSINRIAALRHSLVLIYLLYL